MWWKFGSRDVRENRVQQSHFTPGSGDTNCNAVAVSLHSLTQAIWSRLNWSGVGLLRSMHEPPTLPGSCAATTRIAAARLPAMSIGFLLRDQLVFTRTDVGRDAIAEILDTVYLPLIDTLSRSQTARPWG